ncbi:MAG: DUF938 domain-containing protein [Kofleriaceae bacterium]|nr:DUF938 domain-containing protein [Kofleriaceae bacterium]
MKMSSAPAARNAAAIQEVLRTVLPMQGLVLEVASGTGQHAAHFCEAMPTLRWQPSDLEESSLESVEAWRKECTTENFLSPIVLDVCANSWPIQKADAIFCANMIHISPWATTLGLFALAASVLSSDAPVVLYGPFLEDDVETAEGNLSFDQWLQARDSRWNIRRLEDVRAAADKAGFQLQQRVEMPANNLCLVFRKS